jgi:hypothetical protein
MQAAAAARNPEPSSDSALPEQADANPLAEFSPLDDAGPLAPFGHPTGHMGQTDIANLGHTAYSGNVAYSGNGAKLGNGAHLGNGSGVHGEHPEAIAEALNGGTGRGDAGGSGVGGVWVGGEIPGGVDDLPLDMLPILDRAERARVMQVLWANWEVCPARKHVEYGFSNAYSCVRVSCEDGSICGEITGRDTPPNVCLAKGKNN